MPKKKKINRSVSKPSSLNVKLKNEKLLFAFLSTFLSIIGFVLALIFKRDDKYVMYYAKHSLLIFIVVAVIGVIGNMLWYLPIIGGIIYGAVVVFSFLLWVVSWLYALTNEKREIPVITKYAEMMKI